MRNEVSLETACARGLSLTRKGNVRIRRMCAVLARNIAEAPSQLLSQSCITQLVNVHSLAEIEGKALTSRHP
jgi:hypothetical protein